MFVNPNWIEELKKWALSIQLKNKRYQDDEYFRYF